MKALLFLIAAATAMGVAQGQANTFVCDIPTAGCTNGMFNQTKCECECISPFCPDMNGDCMNPSDNCGGNQWAECTRGVNCPWWVNPLKAESCTTGPSVPTGLWKIYNTMEACCNSNFAYSTTCIVVPASEQPTKHPTIVAPVDDVYEVVPIKFDVMGLPDQITMRDLKDEMTTVLKRILLRLADRIPGLRISSVEEKIVMNRNLLRALRALEQDVSLYFNVYVIRDENKKFGPIIISEIRDSYSEVLDQIQTFTDTKYFGASLDMNWCTSQNGKFELCVQEITPQPSPAPPPPVRAPTPIIMSNPPPADGGGGLPGWAIALIVIVILLLLCCLGYFIFLSCAKDHDESKEIHNNIYMENNKSRGGFTYDKSRGGSIYDKSRGESIYGKSMMSQSTKKSRRSRRTRSDETQDQSHAEIVLSEPQDPKFYDDTFSVNTYGTKKNQGRDPTMFIPGQENRPDPDNDILMIADGVGSSRRYYSEDPPLKPKRDPTMYVDGQASARDPSIRSMQSREDPSVYVEGQTDPSVYTESGEDPSVYVEGQQDPTMYVDGASIDYHSVGQGRGVSVQGSNADPYGMAGIDESDYERDGDSYGFKRSSLEAVYMTSETNAEHARGNRDPSFYAQENSFQTQDPSISPKSKRSGRSGRSKRSNKSKKSSRSGR